MRKVLKKNKVASVVCLVWAGALSCLTYVFYILPLSGISKRNIQRDGSALNPVVRQSAVHQPITKAW